MIVPKLGEKSKRQKEKMPLTGIPGDKVPQDTSEKICSTMICPRCNAEQDRWRATCRKCRACFYCGLIGGGTFLCQICGNQIPPEDRLTDDAKVIRIS